MTADDWSKKSPSKRYTLFREHKKILGEQNPLLKFTTEDIVKRDYNEYQRQRKLIREGKQDTRRKSEPFVSANTQRLSLAPLIDQIYADYPSEVIPRNTEESEPFREKIFYLEKENTSLRKKLQKEEDNHSITRQLLSLTQEKTQLLEEKYRDLEQKYTKLQESIKQTDSSS